MTVPGPGSLPEKFRRPAHHAEAEGAEGDSSQMAGLIGASQLSLGVALLNMSFRSWAISPNWNGSVSGLDWSFNHSRCLT